MTTPDDPALWWSRLAETLLDAGRRIGQLAEQVERDWPDARGREWAEHTTHVRAELGREAVAAAELGAQYVRRDADRAGARLAGTEAHRVDDERGMRIAELPDPPPR